MSGQLRQNSYEFGLLVRIIPLRYRYPTEALALQSATCGWSLVSLLADHFDKLSDVSLCTTAP